MACKTAATGPYYINTKGIAKGRYLTYLNFTYHPLPGPVLYLNFFTRSSVSTLMFPPTRHSTRFPECTVSQTIDSYSTGWDGYCQTDDTTACLDVPASDSDADALKCAVPKTGYYIDATGEAKRNVKSKCPPTMAPIPPTSQI